MKVVSFKDGQMLPHPLDSRQKSGSFTGQLLMDWLSKFKAQSEDVTQQCWANNRLSFCKTGQPEIRRGRQDFKFPSL